MAGSYAKISTRVLSLLYGLLPRKWPCNIHVCMHVFVRVCMCACMPMYIRILCNHVCTYVFMYVLKYKHDIYICTHEIYVCLWSCMYIFIISYTLRTYKE